MHRGSGRLEAVMLAVTLFVVSGAALVYNIGTLEGEGLSASLSELLREAPTVSVMSEAAAARLIAREAVSVSVEPSEEGSIRDYELLEPIVKAPKG